jgi:hypothetical protein
LDRVPGKEKNRNRAALPGEDWAAFYSLFSADAATAAASIPHNEARVYAYNFNEANEDSLEWHHKKPHCGHTCKRKTKISPFVPGRGFAAAPSLSSAAVASAAFEWQVSGKCSAMWGGISGKRKLALAVFMG